MAASEGLPASIPEIGKIERLALRQVWRHEALDFTTWLEHNTDVLSEALGVSIDNVERERAAGSFSVDLVGEDQLGNSVVIENQLERSDHDHLAKLITYAAADQANDQGPAADAPSYPASNRYKDPATAALFQAQADALFPSVLASRPHGARELSLGIQSLVWYASIAPDHAKRRAAAAIRSWAGRLGDEERTHSPADFAYEIRGLIEAGRVTGSREDLAHAATAFRQLVRGFDDAHGVLRGTTTLTTDEVAEITGAFNAAQLFLGDRIDQARANTVFGAWWEGSVNLSGMEISSPAVDQMKAAYELLDPPGRGTTPQPTLNYRYPTVPLPQDAGGEHGIAPVLAASVTWDGHEWTADHDRFDVAGAMHAADEMIWMHSDEISGFPQVTLR